MSGVQFKKATKQAAKLRLGLIGPAGSGKTFTALTVAKSLGGRVAVIDTERGSASKYADLFEFDVLELGEFSPQQYAAAIRAAAEAGYEVIIIDSLSHAWVGKGGALEMHDRAVDRQKVKNSFTAWADVTPHHMAMIEAIVQSSLHVIATMRSKTEYVQEKDERTGKTTVRKVGMAPVQRDGMEYEFDVVGDLDADNTLVVTKSRCPALTGAAVRKPGAEFAATLKAWLGGAPAEGPKPQAAPVAPKADPKLPANGKEFQTRLSDYDQKLANQKLIRRGDLMMHVHKAGVERGYPDDVTQWGRDAIEWAAHETKDFETLRRREATSRPAAASA